MGQGWQDFCQKIILANPILCHLANSKAAFAALSFLRMVRLPSALKLLGSPTAAPVDQAEDCAELSPA